MDVSLFAEVDESGARAALLRRARKESRNLA